MLIPCASCAAPLRSSSISFASTWMLSWLLIPHGQVRSNRTSWTHLSGFEAVGCPSLQQTIASCLNNVRENLNEFVSL